MSYHMTHQDTTVRHEESILARNKVLRQTYILLAANIAFSALCAFIGIMLNVNIPWFLYLAGLIGFSFLVNANRNSGLGILFLFALTGLVGFSLSNILSLYFGAGMGNIVFKALVGTAIIFFSLSAYVVMTGKNFTFLGGFLFVAVMVLILASLGAMLFNMTALSVIVSAAALIIFSGYVLYDTSNIIQGAETNYITATLSLFINILNIFTSLLNLLSIFNND